MRKIRFTIMAAAMAAIFITSGCVKNEESEGVKELRKGQAALLQARAAATTMEAEAEAAYRMAQAAVQEAYAQVQVAYARQAEIANELREAENEITIAELQLELEVLQATQESEIAKAVAEAKELLNAAEKDLLASIRELEVAIAENDNLLLKEYLDLYTDAMAEVVTARDEIINETEKLARYQIYVNGVSGDLVAEKLREQEKLEKELVRQELYKTKLEALLDSPEVTDEELAEASKKVDSLNIELAKLYKQEVELDEAENVAWDALQDASDEYYDARDIVTYHPGTIDNWTNDVGFSAMINNPEFDPAINSWFQSKAWYEQAIAGVEEQIANWQSDIADFEVQLATEQAVYDVHAAKLAELYTAYVTAEDAYQAAELAYQVAQAEYEADPSAENLTARDAALADRDAALIVRNDALAEHDAYKATYYDSALANVESTQNMISLHEDWIAGAQENIADFQADLEVVVDYIAFLQGELDAALLIYDDVKLAYKEANDAWVVANDAYNEIWDQINDLQTDLGYAEWYVIVLEDNNDDQLAAMDDIVSQIAGTKAAIAELDVTFASWESAIAAQQAKIEVLEAELAYWEAVAADYKVMFEGEMGNE